jgi:Rod binding domain-containing protein
MDALPVSTGFLRPADPTAKRGQSPKQMRETAQAFEASFLSQMLKPMFEGLETDGPFGGGEGESTWRSFLIDAMAKQAVKAGGIGMADTVMSEMLKMQEQPA